MAAAIRAIILAATVGLPKPLAPGGRPVRRGGRPNSAPATGLSWSSSPMRPVWCARENDRAELTTGRGRRLGRPAHTWADPPPAPAARSLLLRGGESLRRRRAVRRRQARPHCRSGFPTRKAAHAALECPLTCERTGLYGDGCLNPRRLSDRLAAHQGEGSSPPRSSATTITSAPTSSPPSDASPSLTCVRAT
jgi:hypothetical protein